MDTPTTDMDGSTVYLCQISPKVSCGACCGLYNVADPSYQALEAVLMRQTQWFADVPRTVAGIDAFRIRVEGSEPQERPFADFHHCPFLGMIADTGTICVERLPFLKRKALQPSGIGSASAILPRPNPIHGFLF